MTAALAVYGWRRHYTPGAKPFVVMAAAVSLWSLSYALELSSTTLPAKLSWSNLTFVGITTAAAAWLAFALQFIGRGKWLTRRNLALLAIQPIAVILLTWTNDAHNLFRIDARMVPLADGSTLALDPTYGIAFWLHGIYCYVLLLAGALLLGQAFFRAPRYYRRQTGVMLLGALIPWLANVLYLVAPHALSHLDATPFAFGLSSLAVAWGLFHFRLLDIVPVARDVLVEEMSDGVLVLDGQDRILDLNPAALQIIGHPPGEIIGSDVAQVLPTWPSRHATPPDETEDYAEIALAKDDPARVFDLRITPLYDHQARLTGRMAILRDITERKRASAALQASEEQFRLLAENFQDGLVIFDRESGRALYANPTVAAILGLPLAEILAPDTARTFRQLIHEDDLSLVQDASRRAAEARKQGHAGRVELEFRIRRPDGAVRWIQQRSYPIAPLGPHAAQVCMILSDITARKESEEEREKLIEELDAFAITVAHDLKSPLAFITGMAEVLVHDLANLSAQEVETSLDEIVQHGHKMGRIVDELLSLARLYNAEAPITPLHMDEIVAEAQQQLAVVIREHQAEIRLPDSWPVALGYGPWIEEVWVNYLSNAIKYGGRPPHLNLGADLCADGTARFWVHDNGPGLAPAQQARLFTPFTRIDHSQAPGHGLGLSIVRRIIERLGGQTGVESAGVPGRGSTFWFTLPVPPPETGKQA
jgi:PAS domain S-box-containing protein